MSAERTYQGKGAHGSLEKALNAAVELLAADIGEGGVADGLASWTLKEISGEYGGIAGLNDVKVTITARRSPPWK